MRRTIRLTVGLLSLTWAHAVFGGGLVVQTMNPSISGALSNLPAPGVQSADDFVLNNETTLNGFAWFGRYEATQNVTGPVTFSIRVFADVADAPAVDPILDVVVVATTILTGIGFNGTPWFAFGAPIPDSVLSPGRYWVSILENDPSTTMDWLWAGSNTTGTRAIRFGDDAAWNLSAGMDHAFSVGGTVVPLPAAVWLFGAGLLVLLRVGRSTR